MKIIIAEDEQRTRQGLTRIIEELGEEYEVIAQASNGQSALELILAMQPDVAFVDVKMPFLDGLSVIRAVRAHGLSTEFIVASAYADFDFAQQSISLDVAGYLLKPVTRGEAMTVLKKVQKRLERKMDYAVADSVSLRNKYPDAHPLIRKALDIIEKCYAGKISQKELSAELGISAEYFSYLFTKNIQTNFSAFVRDYRIEQAKRLYRSGEYDRKEVPYRVGFSDAKYFNRVFREATGESPAEYLAKIGK
ncbi:MAG: response regulator [Lachnospiraceae bacterium]|nr:response regulator [Lachnospiraceae bacterium]